MLIWYHPASRNFTQLCGFCIVCFFHYSEWHGFPPFPPYIPDRISHHCLEGWSAHTGFAKSKYMSKGGIRLRSGAIQFSEAHGIVVDSFLVTLLSFTRAFSPIHHSSMTILLPDCLLLPGFSISNGSWWSASGLGSDCYNISVRFQTSPKT